MLAWAAWKLQQIPTAWGTLRNLFTEPSEQVAAPSGILSKGTFVLMSTKSSVQPAGPPCICVPRQPESSLQFVSHPLLQLLLEGPHESLAPSSSGLATSADPTGRVLCRVLCRVGGRRLLDGLGLFGSLLSFLVKKLHFKFRQSIFLD